MQHIVQEKKLVFSVLNHEREGKAIFPQVEIVKILELIGILALQL